MTATKALIESSLKLDMFLPYRLNVLANLMSKALARVYSERWNIDIPDWRILATLAETGSMTQKAIGAHTHLDKTKMSRSVAHLEARGLIIRQVNSKDKREAFLTLSPQGQVIFAEIAPLALEFTAQIEARLQPEQQQVFDQVLKILTERAKELAAEITITVA